MKEVAGLKTDAGEQHMLEIPVSSRNTVARQWSCFAWSSKEKVQHNHVIHEIALLSLYIMVLWLPEMYHWPEFTQ